MDLAIEILTFVHVAISLIAIVSGFILIIFGFLASRALDRWTVIFLTTTLATSITGFFFPFRGVTPALAFGVLSLIILTLALYALYGRQLRGSWRWIYLLTAMLALYLNTFVLIVQAFLKVPALHALAPNGNEPPFAIAQGLLLMLFIALTALAIRRFHPGRP